MRFIHSINTKEYVKMGNICCLAYFPFLNKNPSIFYIFANNNLISKVCMNLYFLSQLIALFSLFLEKAESASTPVVWTASPYFVTGRFSFTPSASGPIADKGSCIYSNALTGPPSRMVVLGIVDWEYKLPDADLIFFAYVQFPASNGFAFNITSNDGSYIVNLVLSYLTADPSFAQPFSMTYFNSFTGGVMGPFNLAYYINFTLSTGVILDLTHDNAMLAFQHIMDINSPSACFDLEIVFGVFNQSFYEVQVSTQCADMTLYQFGFSRMIFDKTAIQNLGYCYFEYGELQSTNGNTSPLQFATTPFFGSNFMMGMKSYYLSGLNRFKFATTIGASTSVASNINYKFLSFMYWSFKLRVCPTGYPYFEVTNELCYDLCPDGTQTNLTTTMCLACSYACQTCSSFSVCTNCDPSTNRYLNGTSCPPKPGYFENQTAQIQNAVPCIDFLSNCLTCTNEVTCTSCSSGTYLASNATCKLCNSSIANCLTCSRVSSTVTCSACQASYSMSSGNTSCSLPPCTDSNCILCPADPNLCQKCNLGYSVSNYSCITVCGDGIKVGTEQCDDNNTVDGDGCNADCTAGNNNNCSSSTPLFLPNSTTCSATCPDGSFANYATYSCDPCPYQCSTCFNSSACDSCSAPNNWQLNGTDCLPLPGFYDDGHPQAVPCVAPCDTCQSLPSCTTCVVGFYISGTTCILCSDLANNCTQCSVSSGAPQCKKCDSGFLLNSTTFLCDDIPCNDLNCLSCPIAMSSCLSCTSGYQAIAGQCMTVCGDFVKMPNEQCDDGNNIAKDGCSDTCIIEQDFQCEPKVNYTQGSACFYIGTVTVTKVYIDKLEGQNKIEIKLSLSPNDMPIWDSVDFLDMLQINSSVPITGYTVNRNADGTVSIIVDYAGDIQDQPMSITVDPSRTGLDILSRTSPTTTNLVITPDDNEGAYFYPDQVYQLQGVVQKLAMAIALLSLTFFVIGIISAKMVGIEMMAVVQISFFSLVSLSQLNPCFAALSNLLFANGYNSLHHNHLQDQLTPIQPKGIQLFSRFTENFNFTLALVLIPVLVALVCFILSKTAFKNNVKLNQLTKKLVGEYAFMGLMFGAYMIAVSFALQVMFGMKNTVDLIGKVSLVECSLLLLSLVVYFFFLIFKPQFFGQFTESFKMDRVSSKFYNFMLVERVLVGSSLIFLLSVKFEGAVPMVVFVATGVFILVKKPYKENHHNHRQIANMAISTAVVAIYVFYRMSSPSQTNTSPIFFYLPFIVCALLLICVVYSSVAIVYSIYKYFTSNKNMQDVQKEELEELAKHRKMTMYSIGSDLSNSININSFTAPSLKEGQISPSSLKKSVFLDDLKKSIKLNNSIILQKSAMEMIRQNDEDANEDFRNQYDQI